MWIWVKEGGDPNFWWYHFGIHRYEVPNDIIEELRAKLLPNLKPLKIKVPLGSPPRLVCGACGISLPSKPTFEELLAQTHIHSSLVLEDGTIFLLDLVCAAKIRDYFNENYHSGVKIFPAPDCGEAE